MNRILVYILGILCALNIAAQDTVKQVNLDGVSVSAKRIEQKENAPSGDNLTKKHLEIINTQNAGDAAKFLGGVTVKDYGGLGGVKTVSVRGLSSNHTSVLYDGINLFDNQSGQIDLSKYSLSSINSLSLANAQFNSFLPTASSLASSSTVDIQTLRPDMGAKQFKGDASLTYGSFNMFNAALFAAAKVSNKDIVTLIADVTNTDGKYPYKIYYGAGQTLSTNKKIRENNDLFSLHTELNWFRSFSAKNSMKAKVFYYDSDRGLPSSVNLYYNNSKQRLQNRNFFAQTSFLSSVNDRISYKNNLKFDWNYTFYTDPNYLGSPQGERDRYIQNLVYMNNAVNFRLTDALLAALTNDLSYSSLNSTVLDDKPQRFTSLTALVLNYTTGKTAFTANVIHSLYNDGFENSHRTDNYLSPYFSIRYESGRWTSTVFYKNIFRMPTFNELYYRRMGKHDLLPEKTDQYSWANIWTFDLGKMFFVPEIDVYYNNVKDKIVAIPQNQFIWSMLNYGKVDIYGIDVKLNCNYTFTKDIKAELKLNYSYQKAVDKDKDSPTYKQNLPYMPENIGSAVLGVDYKRFRLGYTCLYVDKRWSLQENIPQNLLKAYTDHSANISYRIKPSLRSIENVDIMFSCNNIFNHQYEVIRAYPMMGRNFNIKIKLNF
ncbi:MAG: TonB-dependent receptor plug domain-containing protein [Bacteroidales bacterium]|nr:TonB-dependent receptor plug domain-containing protein [Bacteroidales bacterium]